jgi:demethylmenaquinone methyltransferase/2-methoxy-6-polyprenyl-1,4-benzoquinol methylase
LKAIARLRLKPDDHVLEVSCGTGTNLALMQEALAGTVALTGLDISRGMLLKCRSKIGLASPPVRLVEAEAAHLPFRDGVFDAVLHHGGLAEFGDTAGALSEMTRVATPGARIVVCDVGVPTDRRLPLMSRLLLRTQPVYRKPPPLELLPAGLQDLQLTWIGGGAWYMIDFSNNPAP